ncbi:MAG: hypothetical protein Q8P15_00965 [Nanoarchaeota archaeon]|nr:hypothetical protein [Nanoarchaeota archaeon]
MNERFTENIYCHVLRESAEFSFEFHDEGITWKKIDCPLARQYHCGNTDKMCLVIKDFQEYIRHVDSSVSRVRNLK